MPTDLLYVLDTHILIWYFIGSRRLPQTTRLLIDETRQKGGRLLVPSIVLAEALDIAEKGRVRFDFGAMFQLIQNDPVFEIVGFGEEIFKETMDLKVVKEIHDRIIVATAHFYGAGILTKDRIIRTSEEGAKK